MNIIIFLTNTIIFFLLLLISVNSILLESPVLVSVRERGRGRILDKPNQIDVCYSRCTASTAYCMKSKKISPLFGSLFRHY